MRIHGNRWIALLSAAVMAAGLTGCTRSQINYQVAECIGTLGQYENNEPVETPKMAAERLEMEEAQSLEEQKQAAFDEAERLAAEYNFPAAIQCLQEKDFLEGDERAKESMEHYQKLQDAMYEFSGDVGHLCFTNLVVDTARAFDGDEYAAVYRSNMITLEEFNNILNTLYDSGYVLVDLHSFAAVSEDERGSVKMRESHPIIPNGKKPLILSVENLDYSSVRNGDGVATRLALDDDGKVQAVYTDEEGHDLMGAYDIVPVLEAFIEEHPGFSLGGARGIISLSGSNGAFGYPVEEGSDVSWEENQKTVRSIADRLRQDGWIFATEGYSYQYMGDMSYDTLKEDIVKWQRYIGTLVGDCDILMFPYGSEVDYATEKAAFLINQGLNFLIGMWSDGDHLEVNDTYLRQTRRTVTGYVFENYPANFNTYFNVANIIDPARHR